MFRLVYVSMASVDFTEAQLACLLEAARRRNATLGVTGLLLFREGDFMQLLEGPEAQVRHVFARICADSRHRNVTVLLEEETEALLFADWSMAFQCADDATIRSLPGFSRFLEDPLRAERYAHSPQECLQLLGLFERMF